MAASKSSASLYTEVALPGISYHQVGRRVGDVARSFRVVVCHGYAFSPSLTTPDKIRTFQRKLYCKAKAEPAFRFYVLYDKICREDILHHAYRLARANAGAPGVDEVTFAQIEERGLEAWLAGLRKELVSKTYRPDPNFDC